MLQTAHEHYRLSALRARSAAREARRARSAGARAVGEVINRNQLLLALESTRAVDRMLDEQGLDAAAEALLNSAAFTTSVTAIEQMLDEATVDAEFDRLVTSLVQDAGRAAEEVAVAVRPHVGHVRYLNPPSCSRCAVLAGRVYRYSTGFLRHPGCDCIMIPTTLANTEFVQDPVDLLQRGLVTGLSKADRAAILDGGADFNKVVNVRAKQAGLHEAGRVLSRRGKLTPEAIFRASDGDRDTLIRLLDDNGYTVPSRPATDSSTSAPTPLAGGRGNGAGSPPPRVRGMLGGDTPDEFGEINGYQPPAKRSQIGTFDDIDAASLLDGDETPEETRRIRDRVRARVRVSDYVPPHGGHRYGSGWGKDEFPPGWDTSDVRDWVNAIIDAPTRAEPGRRDGFSLWGTFRGVYGVVHIRSTGAPSSWYVATAYPQDVPS